MERTDRDSLRISVVIPVRDGARAVEQSLSGLVKQDFPLKDFEVLVIDDGSTEDLRPLVRRFRERLPNLRLLRQPPKGPAAARNLGIRESCAPNIIFLDSDVLPDRDLILNLLTAMDQNPIWRAAEARVEPIGGEKTPLWDGPICSHGRRYHTAAIIYRRDVLIEAGGLDESFELPACEDVELAVRILSRGTIGFVPEAVVHHPRRRVTLGMHWRWRRYWKYEMILAKRYGILGFPEHSAGNFPRLRVAVAAVVTLPGGRLFEACKRMEKNIIEAMQASFYALFDVICGIFALSEILFSSVPLRKNYLENPS